MRKSGSGFKDFVDPDPDPKSGSMGKKNEEKNALFLNFLNGGHTKRRKTKRRKTKCRKTKRRKTKRR
jgi:hypothetical protein